MELIERELGWEDEIENEGSPFVLLPAGDYDFVVESFERARFAGSEKVPPCNQAILKLGVDSPDGHAVLTCNLFLHTKFEWKLCQFFTSIGQRRHGEKQPMNWAAVIGARGRIRVNVREYDKKTGGKGKSNDVDAFLEPAETETGAPAGGFTPGAF